MREPVAFPAAGPGGVVVLTRPRRQVVDRPAGFSVEPPIGAPFVTPDRALAERVAAEFDQRDPLPLPPHDCTEDVIELSSWASAEPLSRRCAQCGETV